MRSEDLRERRIRDTVFGLLLVSGLSVGYVFYWTLRNWITPLGEGAFAIYIFGLLSLIPTGLAWLASGLQSFRDNRDRDVRLGALLVTCHLVAWAVVVAVLASIKGAGPGWIIPVVALEPGIFAAGATYLAVRWFRVRRRRFGDQVAA